MIILLPSVRVNWPLRPQRSHDKNKIAAEYLVDCLIVFFLPFFKQSHEEFA